MCSTFFRESVNTIIRMNTLDNGWGGRSLNDEGRMLQHPTLSERNTPMSNT